MANLATSAQSRRASARERSARLMSRRFGAAATPPSSEDGASGAAPLWKAAEREAARIGDARALEAVHVPELDYLCQNGRMYSQNGRLFCRVD